MCERSVHTGWSISSDSWVGLTLIYDVTILPSFPATAANFPSAQAEPDRGWNSQNLRQPNRQLSDQMEHPEVVNPSGMSTNFPCFPMSWPFGSP